MMTNVLVFSPHPDDAELYAGGSLLLHTMRYKVGLINMTNGELSSNGSVLARKESSNLSKDILKLAFVHNLNIQDGTIDATNSSQQKLVIEAIRKYKPSIILIPYDNSMHPDHRETTKLIEGCIVKAGIKGILYKGEPHLCNSIFYYIMDEDVKPDVLIDISDVYKVKKKAIYAYDTQFIQTNEYINTQLNNGYLLDRIIARDRYYGSLIGTQYAEGFIVKNKLVIDSFFDLYLSS